VELEGIRRARDAVDGADLILAVFDGSEPLAEDDHALLAQLADRPVIAVANKADLPQRADISAISAALGGQTVHTMSTISRHGVETLTHEVSTRLGGGPSVNEGAFVTRLRHVEALKRAEGSLVHLEATLAEHGPHECIALDLRGSVDALGEILGTVTSDDVLNEIFSKFCIGK
jgi:tRNA modification GTPase